MNDNFESHDLALNDIFLIIQILDITDNHEMQIKILYSVQNRSNNIIRDLYYHVNSVRGWMQ